MTEKKDFYDVAKFSEKGGRATNQDYCEFLISENIGGWILADGLGGHGGGEVASKLAVERVVKDFSTKQEMSENGVGKYIFNAHNLILEEQKKKSELKNMRTTLVMFESDGTNTYYGYVGDSRFYFFRNNKVIIQTKDHSVPQMLVESGEIKYEDIRNHPDRNRILRALGQDFELVIDVKKLPFKMEKGDAFLLCTDGLWEFITESDMENFLATSKSASEWLDKMRNTISKNITPKNDNFSAIGVIVNGGELKYDLNKSNVSVIKVPNSEKKKAIVPILVISLMVVAILLLVLMINIRKNETVKSEIKTANETNIEQMKASDSNKKDEEPKVEEKALENKETQKKREEPKKEIKKVKKIESSVKEKKIKNQAEVKKESVIVEEASEANKEPIKTEPASNSEAKKEESDSEEDVKKEIRKIR